MAANIFDIDLMLIQEPALLFKLHTWRAKKEVKKTAALIHQMLAVITLSPLTHHSLQSTACNLPEE